MRGRKNDYGKCSPDAEGRHHCGILYHWQVEQEGGGQGGPGGHPVFLRDGQGVL